MENRFKIWVYTLSYNEEHFVKNFLTAYKDAERIIVNDNMSTDRTVELLKQDPRVEVRTYDSGNKIRDDLYLEFKNNAWKEARGKADWVIIVDFDEIFTRVTFIDGQPVFDLDLSRPYDLGFDIIKPWGYNMVSLDAPLGTDDFPYVHSPKGCYHVPQEKMCCFRPDKLMEIGYFAGCHRAEPLDMNGGKGMQTYFSPEYKGLHYKFWNLDLYMEKMKDYQTRLSDVNKSYGWGWHYMESLQSHHDLFTRGFDISKNLIDIESPYK